MDSNTITTLINRWHRWIIIGIPLFLATVTFIVYYPSLWYPFMFDDLPTIINYLHIRVIDFSGQFFGNPRWISRLWNQITFHYWKDDPFGYRIVDVVMHCVIGILAFSTLLRLFTNLKRNTFIKEYALVLTTLTTTLFLLHPIQTQTVPYITQMRLEGLMLFLSMLVITTFVFAATTQHIIQRRILYALSFVFMAFSGGTKEIVIVLPVLLILVDWFFIAEGDWSSFKSRWMIHAVYCVVLYGLMFKYGYLRPHYVQTISTSQVHNNRGNILTTNVHEPIRLYSFMISQFKVLVHYLYVFIWPPIICFDYEIVLSKSLFSFDVLIPMLLITAIVGGAAWLYYRYPCHVVSFGLAWFFITMFPRTSIFPTTELICDYKTYPASLGLMIVLAYGILLCGLQIFKWLAHTRLARSHIVTASTALLSLTISLAVWSGIRNTVWRSEYDFWGDVIAKNPHKSRGYNNYAIALWEMGKTQEAIDHFYKAIERDGWYAEPHINLATIYQVRNETDKALEHYKRALDIGEAHPELFNNLGMLHFNNQSWQAAEYCLKEAIKLCPHYSKSHFNLGKLYQILGRRNEAIACYENAINGDKAEREMFYLHGTLCFEVGRYQAAIQSLEKIDKNYQDTAFILGCCYYSLPSYAKAAENLAIAYKKDSRNPACVYNYAQALMNLRRYQEALPLIQQCANQPDIFPYARLHRVKCMYELGQKQEAQKALKELIAGNTPKQIIQDAKALQKELKLT